VNRVCLEQTATLWIGEDDRAKLVVLARDVRGVVLAETDIAADGRGD